MLLRSGAWALPLHARVWRRAWAPAIGVLRGFRGGYGAGAPALSAMPCACSRHFPRALPLSAPRSVLVRYPSASPPLPLRSRATAAPHPTRRAALPAPHRARIVPAPCPHPRRIRAAVRHCRGRAAERPPGGSNPPANHETICRLFLPY